MDMEPVYTYVFSFSSFRVTALRYFACLEGEYGAAFRDSSSTTNLVCPPIFSTVIHYLYTVAESDYHVYGVDESCDIEGRFQAIGSSWIREVFEECTMCFWSVSFTLHIYTTYLQFTNIVINGRQFHCNPNPCHFVRIHFIIIITSRRS